MSWRLAKSLETFIAQQNHAAPHRSKASDGTIGDAAHQAEQSDHNPNSRGVVTAFDDTEDPAGGADMAKVSEALRKSRDPRVKYAIYSHRMFSSYATGSTPAWTWRAYEGPDPHTNHLHLSVSAEPRLYDDPKPWACFGGKTKPPKPRRRKGPRYPGHPLREGDRSRHVLRVKRRLRQLNRAFHFDPNRYYGQGLRHAVSSFQRHHGLRPDGITGPRTWAALFERDA